MDKAPTLDDLARVGITAADMAYVFGPWETDSMRVRCAIRAYLWAVESGLKGVSVDEVLAALGETDE